MAEAPRDFMPDYEAAAKKHGVPVEVLRSMIEVESGGNQNTRDGVGHKKQHSVGIGQMQLSTAKGLGFTGTEQELRSNPSIGIDLAARYLADNYRRSGDYRYAVAGYYGGPGKMGHYGTPQGDKKWNAYTVDRNGKLVAREAPSINEHVNRFTDTVGRLYPNFKFGPLQALGTPGTVQRLAPGAPEPVRADAFEPMRQQMQQFQEGAQNFSDLFSQAYKPVYQGLQGGIEDLRGQLSGAMTQLQNVMGSYSGQFEPPGPDMVKQGIGQGFANLATAVSGDGAYRDQFQAAKQQDLAAQRAEGMQRRAEALNLAAQRWEHIRDRLEAQGDKYNALQAEEKRAGVLAQIEKLGRDQEGDINLRNQGALQKQRDNAEMDRLLIGKGITPKRDENGDIVGISGRISTEATDVKLPTSKDHQDVIARLAQLRLDAQAKGKDVRLLGLGAPTLQAHAAWQEGDDAASPLRRMQAARGDLIQLFPNAKPADIDAMIAVTYTDMLRSALSHTKKDESGQVISEYVPNVTEAAIAAGIIPKPGEVAKPAATGQPTPAEKKPTKSVAEFGSVMLMSRNGEHDEAYLPAAKKVLSQYVKVTKELDQRSEAVRTAGGNPDLTNLGELRDKKKKLVEQLEHLGFTPVDMTGSK